MATPPPTTTTILPQGSPIDAFYVNKPFNISFDISSTYSSVVSPTYQLCNSYSALTSNITSNGSNFVGSFTSTGYKQFLQVDALVPTGTTVVSTYRSVVLPNPGTASYPGWDSNGRMYFSDNDSRIFRMTVDNSYEVFAGQPTQGFEDGDRLTTARFTIPRGIIFDSNGDMILAMEYNIRKIDMSTGQVSTLAGPITPTLGFANGTGSAARFRGALTIRLEPGNTGNFILGDYANHCIRKITPTGTVTTILGTGGVPGYLNGTGTSTRFNRLADFVYTPSGDMFIVDQFNFRIRKATPSYVVTNYAGAGSSVTLDGPLASAGFGYPTSIEVDASGNFYIPEFAGNVIRRIEGSNVTTWAGQVGVFDYVDGTLCNARFQTPQNMRRYGDTLYVSDTGAFPFRMRAITTVTAPGSFPLVSRPAGFTVLATSNYPITVNSRIDVSWTSVGGVLPLFKFEPFSNTFTAKPDVSGDTMTYSTTSTELIGYMTGTGTSQASFRGPNGATTVYPYALNLIVRANSNGMVVDDISTSVTISPARIVYSPCNSTLNFYRNEPISPVAFSILCNAASNIYSATTLPTGLSLTRTASNTFTLGGTPTVQSVSSNYTILGQDTSGRTYTTQVSMLVNPERVLIDVSGSTSISGLLSNVPITPVTFKALFPPYGQFRAITYSWTAPPPAGIQFFRSNGDAVFGTSAQISTLNDSSFSLTLAGTITQAQVEAFAAANISNYTISLTATRSAGGTPLSPSVPTPITFALAPVLLFTSNVPRTFVNLPVSNWYYGAKTYFADVSVSSIQVTSGFLPDGLVGTFNSLAQRFEISGTPTTVASYGFTLLATAGSYSASLPVSLTTSNDRAFFLSTVDTCYNFIQYRALSNAKTGYYPSPIRYDVSSASGNPVTLSGTNLPTGVSLDVCGSRYVLNGVPLTVTGLSTATLTASVAASGVSDTSTFQYSVSPEVFTFDASAFSFVQNVPMTPQQVVATTFSEQPILRYSATGLPPALTVANTGLVSGTVEESASGSFTVSAFTAYSSGSETYSYTVTPDKVLLVPSTYSLTTAPGCNVSLPITGYSVSARGVSNYRFQDAFPYGLGINSTTGLLSGTLSSPLPAVATFTLLGSAGLVDGSLAGTMTTTNLTVNRAQILRNDWANFFPDVSTLYVYSSDISGLSWTNRLGISNSVYASTIGTNGSNLYLIPTSSNYILRSSNTTTFTSNDYDVSSATPYATSIVNKRGTSTWWMVGTRATGVSTRGTFLYTTSNDGITWTSNEITAASARDKNLLSSGQWTPYINGGAALAYKDGVLLFGGTRILRSTDEGQTWSTVTGGFTKEVGFFSVDHETVWVATGSDTYETLSNSAWTGATANTICYSLDTGLSWTYAANGFNMNGYGVAYGRGAWMAYGLCNTYPSYVLDVLYSFDAVNWTRLTDVSSVVGPLAGTVRPDPLRMTVAFDTTEWKVIAPTSDTSVAIHSHPYDTPLTAGWTSNDITTSFPNFGSNTELTSYVAETLDPGADITTITFPLPNNGPTFVSPAQSTFVVWQYMPVPAITFTAVGTAPISYFISSLPVGLSWNSTTRSVTGSCMRTGTQTFTVYAEDGVGGVTAFPVTLLVEVPRIIKKQTSAGAYTSLVRQYTDVNAAQTARDSRALPDQTTGIGEFASPYPPSVVTPSNCPC